MTGPGGSDRTGRIELSFQRGALSRGGDDVVALPDEGDHDNDCCYGGDVVLGRFVDALRVRFGAAEKHREDWGWYVELSRGPVHIEVRAHCTDANDGDHTVVLLSRVKEGWRAHLGMTVARDTPELEEVRRVVVEGLEGWIDRWC